MKNTRPSGTHISGFEDPAASRAVRYFRRAKAFFADRSGASAIEFAFLAPILLAVYLSSFEITTGYTVARKVLKAAGTVADVVTRQSTVKKAFLNDMIDTAEATIAPNGSTGLTMKITGVTIDSAGNAKVLWSWNEKGNAPYTKGAAVTVPTNLRTPSSFLIHTEISLPHKMMLFLGGPNGFANSARTITITREFFYRQRMSEDIACLDCS
jgi:Flp pilus assembly protein TadG